MTKTREKLWTVEEYHRMIDAGILTECHKVELLEGRIVQMSPQRPPHAGTTQRTDRYLQNRLRGEAEIRVQLPITLATSEPEPDIAVLRIDLGAYGNRHPNASDIFWLVEVSHTALDTDLAEKVPIYARANIAECWVLDVIGRQAYIFRNSTENCYQFEDILSDNVIIAPAAFGEIEFFLSKLFLPR